MQIINSKTFLLELNSGAFGNRLVWTSCKHGLTGNNCKTDFFKETNYSVFPTSKHSI